MKVLITWFTPLPWPMERKKEERECSAGKVYSICWVARFHIFTNKSQLEMYFKRRKSLKERKNTLISPSADPVAKNSSFGSRAMHFTATEDSCAVNLWRNVRCLKSQRQTTPFRPADIRSWCCAAYNKLVPPFSWHTKAKKKREIKTILNSANKYK